MVQAPDGQAQIIVSDYIHGKSAILLMEIGILLESALKRGVGVIVGNVAV